MDMDKNTCFNELAYAIIEASKFRIYRVGWQARAPERDDTTAQVQRPSASDIPLA